MSIYTFSAIRNGENYSHENGHNHIAKYGVDAPNREEARKRGMEMLMKDNPDLNIDSLIIDVSWSD